MFFTPLYAQQNSTTSSSPEQDIVATDFTAVAQIDTTQSPIHEESDPTPPSEEEAHENLIVQLDDFQSKIDSIENENDDLIVQLDDFQSKMDSIINENDDLIVQLDDFQSRINAIDNEHESFTADLNDFQNMVNAIVEVDEDLIVALNDLQSRMNAIVDNKENIIADLNDFCVIDPATDATQAHTHQESDLLPIYSEDGRE